MKYSALILAAGSGKRISEKFNYPKCLIKINKKSIIERQIESYIHANIKNIFIATGYQSKKISNVISKYKKNANIKLIHNKIYYKTNNMYSAHLATKYLKNTKFILSNGDVVIDKNIVRKLIEGKNDNEIMVDTNYFDEESMKVLFDSKKKIKKISKKIKKSKKSYTSIDFYKFSKKASVSLFDTIEVFLKKNGQNHWTEVAIQKLFNKFNFFPNKVLNDKWFEIDTYKDFVSASNKFNNTSDKIFKNYKNFIVDIDGTTFRKGNPIIGTKDFLNKIEKYKKKIFFLSNNSSMDFTKFYKLFSKVNFNLKKKNMIISTDIVISYLKRKKISRVYATGNKIFLNQLKINKIKIDYRHPQLAIISYDDQINYKKLETLCKIINKGINFIATHDDPFYPSEDGPIPDAGSIIKLVEITTGKKPLLIFGKPSPQIKKFIRLNGKTIMIGDKIDKDIKFAKNCGYDSALVLSGTEKKIFNFKEDVTPNYILSSIKDLS